MKNNDFTKRVQEYIKEAVEEFELYASKDDTRTIFKSVELSNNKELCVMAMLKEGFSCVPDVVVTVEDHNGDEDVIYSTSKYFDVTKKMEDIDDVIQ